MQNQDRFSRPCGAENDTKQEWKNRESNLGNNIVNLYPQYDVKSQDNSPCINPFVKNHLNSVTNYKKLHRDLNKIQNGVDVFIRTINNTEKKIYNNPLQMFFAGVMSIFPASRRLAPIEDNEKQNNRFKAFGLGLLALINLKEDIRDLLSVFGKTKNELDKEYKAVFKFFAGTPVENWLLKSETGRKIFYDIDKSFGDSFVADKILEKFKIKQDSITAKKEIYYPLINKTEIIIRESRKFDCPLLGKVIMLSLNRITKLGLLFACILELPKTISEVKKGNYRQLPKSALNVISYSLFGAVTSSLFAYLFGPAGSVLGLGIGFYIGNQLTKSVNGIY